MVFTPNDKPGLEDALSKWYTVANSESVDAANNYVGPEYAGNPNTWDVTAVTNMDALFSGKNFEHHPLINNWNTKDVSTMSVMFGSSNFNNPINSLPISKFGESVTMSFVMFDFLPGRQGGLFFLPLALSLIHI